MQHAIQNSEPGTLLVEDSPAKLKMEPNASVCFDIPGCCKNRRREAADLDLHAPMLCSDAAPAGAGADADADTAESVLTRMEMTLRLRQCNSSYRRLAGCHQAPRLRSCCRAGEGAAATAPATATTTIITATATAW